MAWNEAASQFGIVWVPGTEPRYGFAAVRFARIGEAFAVDLPYSSTFLSADNDDPVDSDVRWPRITSLTGEDDRFVAMVADAASLDGSLHTIFYMLPDSSRPIDIAEHEEILGEQGPLRDGSFDLAARGAIVYFASVIENDQILVTDRFDVPDRGYTALDHDEEDMEVARVAAIDAPLDPEQDGDPSATVARGDDGLLTLFYPDLGLSEDRPFGLAAAAEVAAHDVAASGTDLVVAFRRREQDGSATVRAMLVLLADPLAPDAEPAALELTRVGGAGAGSMRGPAVAALGADAWTVAWSEPDGPRSVVRMACMTCAGP
jgi:hypothetical protein